MFKPVENLSYVLRRDLLIQYRDFFIKNTNTLPILNDQEQIKYVEWKESEENEDALHQIDGIQRFYWLLDKVTESAWIPVSKQSISISDDEQDSFIWSKRTTLSGSFHQGYDEARERCLNIAHEIYRTYKEKILSLTNSDPSKPVTRADVVRLLQTAIDQKLKESSVLSESGSVVEAVKSSAKKGENDTKFPWFIAPLTGVNLSLDDVAQKDEIERRRLSILHILGEVLEGPITNFEHESSKTPTGLPEISFERVIEEFYNFNYKFDSLKNVIPGLTVDENFKPYPAEVVTVISHLRDVFGINDRRRFLIELARNYKIIKYRVAADKRYAELDRLFSERPRL